MLRGPNPPLNPPLILVQNHIKGGTPAGKRGWFHQSWVEGGEEWRRVKISGEQCPRLSQAFLDEELRELGPEMYRQEYELAFIDDAECVFPVELIERAFALGKGIRPIW